MRHSMKNENCCRKQKSRYISMATSRHAREDSTVFSPIFAPYLTFGHVPRCADVGMYLAASALVRLGRAATKSQHWKNAHPIPLLLYVCMCIRHTLNCALVSGNAIALPPLRTSSLTPEPGSPLSMPATASRSAPNACGSSNGCDLYYSIRLENRIFRCQAGGDVSNTHYINSTT